MSEKLKPGDKLWFVRDYLYSGRGAERGSPQEIEIESVGRKWAQIVTPWSGINRVNIETLWLDRGENHTGGQCYRSLEEYAAVQFAEKREQELREWWDKFRTATSSYFHHPPSYGLTPDDIRAAATLLKLELKDGP